RALSGEMYSTRQRCFGSAGTGPLASRSSAHRNAASVLPDPVGAMTRVLSPPAMDAQAPACAAVGSTNAPLNHSLVSALNPARGSVPAAGASVAPAPAAARARGGVPLLAGVLVGITPSCPAPRTFPSVRVVLPARGLSAWGRVRGWRRGRSR